MATQTKKAVISAKDSVHWTFFSNYAHVLHCLDMGDNKVLRDVALEVGITERAVQNIVADLETEGMITRVREGRRNRYKINRRMKLRHSIESHRSLGDLLNFVNKD